MTKYQRYIIPSVLFLAFSLRMFHLEGDPPAGDISRSGTFYADEGVYAHNAVNKILFDSWFMEKEYNPISNTPVFSVFQFVTLKLLGVSLVSARTGGVMVSVLSLFLLWSLVRIHDRTAAMVAVILGSLSYFYFIYNRLALLENLLVFFLILTAYLLMNYYQSERTFWLVLVSISFWAGYFVKASMIFFLPVIFLVIGLKASNRKEVIQNTLTFVFMSMALLLLSYIFWIHPHQADWDYFQSHNIVQRINFSPWVILKNYARYFFNLKLFAFMPFMYTVFLFYIFYLIYELIQKKRLPFLEWLFLGWTVSALLFLGFYEYSPPRYSLILVPPILALNGLFFHKLFRGELSFTDKSGTFLLIPIGFLSLCQIGFGGYQIFQYGQNFPSCYLPGLSLAAIISFIFMINNKVKHKWVGIFLLCSIGVVQGFQISYYFLNMEYSCIMAIQDMKKIMAQEHDRNQVLVGDMAPLVALETRTKAVNIIAKEELEKDRIWLNQPTYLILQERRELDRLKKKLPRYFEKVKLLKTYRIFHNYKNGDDTYFYRIEKYKWSGFPVIRIVKSQRH